MIDSQVEEKIKKIKLHIIELSSIQRNIIELTQLSIEGLMYNVCRIFSKEKFVFSSCLTLH